MDISEILVPVSDIWLKQLADPSAIITAADYDNRTIWIYDVDFDLIDYVQRYIMAWNREDKGKPVEERKKIYLVIMSYGGSLDACNSIIAAIQASVTPVVGIATGTCCSAGLYILLACDERKCFRFTNFLLHQGSTQGTAGNFGAVMQENEAYRRQIKTLTDWAFTRTKMSRQKFNKVIKGEFYCSDEEAVSFGFVDSIIQSLDEI